MSDRELTSFIYHRDGRHCRYCGVRLRRHEATVDHYVAQALGGSSDHENLRLSCVQCNREKASRSVEDWEITLRMRRERGAMTPARLSKIELLARCAPLWKERSNA